MEVIDIQCDSDLKAKFIEVGVSEFYKYLPARFENTRKLAYEIMSMFGIHDYDRLEYRAVVNFFVLDGLTSEKNLPKFTNVYGNSSPSISIVKKWATEFKRGRTLFEDDPLETIEKVYNITCVR
ncbi:GTF2IRD2B [Cordylochernes scorpioides]|uniref:GTF2IRD2B n=1 Tax=Cordylochernes scorpioides TaxID=51811 RepID=A0ABY6KJZ2_9ARAC|nr:GTF2IRD2B [Cordylochernes scorpioides]